MSNIGRLSSVTGSALVGILAASGAMAQDGSGPVLEEITVTAQKREQSLQDVPISVVALTSSALDDRELKNVTDLVVALPGLQFSAGTGSITPFLRGVGNPSSAVGNESSVAMYTDGVYHTRLPIGFFSLNNIERVEVLRGPQGTLFGRNSTAGVVHIITKTPTQETSVKGSLGYGRFDTFQGDIYAATGITDNLAADISISGQHQDKGWGENTVSGSRYGYRDNFTARTKWVLEASEQTNFELSAFYAYAKSNNQGGTFPGFQNGYTSTPYEQRGPGLVDFYDCDCDTDSVSKSDAWGASITADHEMGFATLKSITAYSKVDMYDLFESDYTPRPDFYAPTESYVEQFTQELQLASLPGSDLTWIAGLYYYDTTSAYTRQEWRSPPNFGPLGFDHTSKAKAKSISGFAQATYGLTTDLNVTGGIRYTSDKVVGSGQTVVPSDPVFVLVPFQEEQDKVDKVTFKASVDYRFTEELMTYVSFSRGYKSPTYNLFVFNPVPNKPEVLDAYEIGFKGDFLGGALRLNGAAFYYDITTPQVQLFEGSTILLANAESGEVKGVELEGQVAISSELTGRFAMTYLDSKFTSFPNAPTGPQNFAPPYGALPLTDIDASGNRTPMAPEFTVNLGFDYAVNTSYGDFLLTADYYYNDGYYFEPDNLLKQDGFHLLSAQLKYTPTESFGVRIWGKNLAGEKYALGAVTQGGAPGYPFYPGAPRTFGLAFDFNF